MINNKIIHNVCFNTIEQSEDGTVLNVKLLIHDFKKTPNGWGITEDTAEKRIKYLINKPIKARYYNEDDNDGMDFLGDHEQSEVKLRGTDTVVPCTDTDSIGVITNAYIDYIDKENEGLGKAVWADGVLWLAENVNTCSLLYEWHTKNIKILTSVEWFYSQSVKDAEGIEWIADPLYSALCVLNSESRGEQPVIYGNYEVANLALVLNQKQYSQFEKALKADLKNKQNNKEEGSEDDKMENLFIKHLNEKSFGEIESSIYDALSKVMVADEYYNVYVSSWNVYDTYFIYTSYGEDGCKYFKVGYENSDNGLVVNYEGKVEVKREDVWVEVKQLNALNKSVEELNAQLEQEKKAVTDLNETITSLNSELSQVNSLVEELTPFKEKVEAEEYEQLLNSTMEDYKEKFNAIGGEGKFETDEVQELIKQTLNAETENSSKQALNEMLVEIAIANAKKNTQTQTHNYKEFNSKMDDLIPTSKGYSENYGFEV